MKFQELSLPGVMLVSLERHHDDRGYFSELLSTELLKMVGLQELPQLNFSSSKPKVFRGMHLQLAPFGQGKLIFCIGGSMTDFILDVSLESPSLGQSIEVSMSEEKPQVLFVPSHYAHGFLAGDNGAQVLYAVTKSRSVDHEVSINYASTTVANMLEGLDPIVSGKDESAMTLDDFVSQYPSHQKHP